ncbi:hypothetical protein L3Q82_018378 [Scortum barcoo]|uniref:Uncharacterized protein n=1 Tax=Scortum barcoo TaxID=214431 RepID=A0ACB8VJ45_9TELE|nr:hypothetical protein L3Q82_018378 [Scortum barcoo]
MEAENMVHSDSMSPASLGICEKLFRRWELKTSLTEGSARRVPNRPSQYALGLPGLSNFLLLPADPTHHQHRSPITEHRWVQIGEAVPPDHAPPGITVVAHVSA